MEIVLAMYGCWSYACDIEDMGNWEWLWSVVEKVMGNVYGFVKLLCKLIN